jgi:hypothetical protein
LTSFLSGKNNLNDNILVSRDIVKKRLVKKSAHVVSPKKPLFQSDKFVVLRYLDYLRLRHPLFTDHWAIYATFSCISGENLVELKFDE